MAEHTVRALLRTVPAAVPGVMFLSGGQARPGKWRMHLGRWEVHNIQINGMYTLGCLRLCRASYASAATRRAPDVA